jgi:hypothetical protein
MTLSTIKLRDQRGLWYTFSSAPISFFADYLVDERKENKTVFYRSGSDVNKSLRLQAQGADL